MRFWKLVLLFVFLAATSHCSQEATPPTPVFGEAELAMVTSQPEESSTGDAGTVLDVGGTTEGDLRLDEVRLHVRSVDLKPENLTDEETDYEGPYVVSLISGGVIVDQATPVLDGTEVDPGTYSLLLIKLNPLEADEVPTGLEGDAVVQESLIGHTLVLEGDFVESPDRDIDLSGGVSRILFRVISDMRSTLQLRPSSPIEILAGETTFLFIALRINSWLESVLPDLQDLNSSLLVNGRILLTPEVTAAPLRSLLVNIETTIRNSAKFALGDDAEFEEGEVDEESTTESTDDE